MQFANKLRKGRTGKKLPGLGRLPCASLECVIEDYPNFQQAKKGLFPCKPPGLRAERQTVGRTFTLFPPMTPDVHGRRNRRDARQAEQNHPRWTSATASVSAAPFQ